MSYFVRPGDSMGKLSGTFARKQWLALLVFYTASLLFAIAAALIEREARDHRLPLLAIACVVATCGAVGLFQFFRTTDEFRQNINRKAVQFAFIGSLLAAIAFALLHSFVGRDVSPYVLPAFMVVLWSIGLFFSARRYE